MWKKRFFWGILCVALFLMALPTAKAEAVILTEGFEMGIPPDWSVDNGVWELCVHAVPEPWGGGLLYVSTVCDGKYPTTTDSRLISPEIDLTAVTVAPDEEVQLRFREWFSYSDDYGWIQIREYDEVAEVWLGWVPLADSRHYSAGWSPRLIDITAYAGKKVQIAFYHNSGSYDTASGWYIDDITMVKKVPEWTWDFECGWNDWSADRGVWEVGSPIYGPSNCYSGTGCAGTQLDGTYPTTTDSRLIGPSVILPELNGYKKLLLSFYHWYSYSDDYGVVQISEHDDDAGQWLGWSPLTGNIAGYSACWTKHPDVDVTAWAGKKIRIAFYHNSGSYNTASGWYIDHIRITGFPHFCECDLNQDGRCDVSDWIIFGEEWGRTDCNDKGVDCECDLTNDGKCDVMDWVRFGEDWGRTDCLLCD